MHAVHPHIPRSMLITLTAALLTVLVLLVFAPRAGDISFGSSSSDRSPALAPAPISSPSQFHEPAWLTNPFASPFHRRVVLPWTSTSAER